MLRETGYSGKSDHPQKTGQMNKWMTEEILDMVIERQKIIPRKGKEYRT